MAVLDRWEVIVGNILDKIQSVIQNITGGKDWNEYNKKIFKAEYVMIGPCTYWVHHPSCAIFLTPAVPVDVSPNTLTRTLQYIDITVRVCDLRRTEKEAMNRMIYLQGRIHDTFLDRYVEKPYVNEGNRSLGGLCEDLAVRTINPTYDLSKAQTKAYGDVKMICRVFV